eukprot:CAMPEP_0113251222 /NCGR_PEP_ID=MMETSP0008_2-20120614/12004_1 /TAXON_ID=97485 /ORGANISM="Prymnesium parvum" /LENGTH=40 /DNA_ID=CAMNT_0000099261 /DNA_START=104 /DNA_END=226 /DNA_ORIENTATION=+ /assembly_acc=CAM_ASM_000153
MRSDGMLRFTFREGKAVYCFSKADTAAMLSTAGARLAGRA